LKKLRNIYLANLLTSGRKADRPGFIQMVLDGKCETLETYWKTNAVRKLLDSYPELKIFLDSGAHSLLTAYVKEQGADEETEDSDIVSFDAEDFSRLDDNVQIFMSQKKVGTMHADGRIRRDGAMRTGASAFINYDFTDNEKVRKYLDEYIEFCHKYKKQLITYVNLDIIFNPEKTWENQKYMESNGLAPLPVYHFGEDLSWFKKYVDQYEYIGISGLGADIQKSTYVRSFGDPVFSYLHGTKQDVKIHGFALTALDLLIRYPWYTVDSTTWVKHAAYGNVIVPKINHDGTYNYTDSPLLVRVSEESKLIKTKSPYYTIKHAPAEVEKIEEYLETIGVDISKLGTELTERTKVNIHFFIELQKFKFEVDHDKYLRSTETFF